MPKFNASTYPCVHSVMHRLSSIWSWALALIIGVICALPANAAPKKPEPTTKAPAVRQRLAVLELTDLSGAQATGATWLGETIRTRAARRMGDKWLLITRENILAMLPPGVDLASCEGDCEVETGRNIGAHALMTGTLSKVEGTWRVNLHLYDTATGAVLRSQQISAARLGDLEGQLERAVDDLINVLPGVLTATEVSNLTVAPAMRKVGKMRQKQLEARPYIPRHQRDLDKVGLYLTTRTSAEVLVDGKLRGRTPLWITEPAGGPWRVEMHARNHHPMKVEVRRSAIKSKAWTVEVDMLPAWDQIRVHSSIEGAVVFIDGHRRGDTPFTSKQLSPGIYRVRVTHPCAPSHFEREVQLTGTESFLDVFAELESQCGALDVQSEPPGAGISSPFGKKSGRYGPKTPHRFSQVPPGRYTIQIEHTGYGLEKREVEIKPGQTTRLGVPLTPLFGTLEVLAEDFLQDECGGYVEIDGVEVGEAPWKGKVQTGDHDITIGCGVAEDAEGRVVVMENQISVSSLKADDRYFGPMILSDPTLNSTYFGFHGWFEQRRPWRVRQGLGFDFGFQGFGPAEDRWSIPGWSVGWSHMASMPVFTPRMELVTRTRLGVGGVTCSTDAAEAGRCTKSTDPRDTLGLLGVSGGGRFHLSGFYVEGGWQLQIPFGAGDFDLDPISGPWVGLGWMF